MAYAVIRVRGQVNVDGRVQDTMRMLRLTHGNHCAVVPKDPSTEGMIRKINDYVTYGEIDAETLAELIATRGRLYGEKPITDEVVAKATGGKYATIAAFAAAVVGGQAKMSELGDDAKLLFRLHPPKGGFEGVKRNHKVGGALGYRGKDINALIRRML